MTLKNEDNGVELQVTPTPPATTPSRELAQQSPVRVTSTSSADTKPAQPQPARRLDGDSLAVG